VILNEEIASPVVNANCSGLLMNARTNNRKVREENARRKRDKNADHDVFHRPRITHRPKQLLKKSSKSIFDKWSEKLKETSW